MSKYYFGIDLGTTNSAISYIEDDAKIPYIIKLEDGDSIIPSCVMYEDGKFIVGKKAYEARYKPNAVYSVKKKMGTDDKIILRDRGEVISMSPEEVSSKILSELVRQAEMTFGKGTIKDVVITVPAYFNNMQRKATKTAGELAGLKVTKIINEPTSASLLYGIEKSEKSELVLVYDLGGGTFDVSILNVLKDMNVGDYRLLGIGGDSVSTGTGVDVVYSDGDTKLGGDDIDKELLNIVRGRVQVEFGYDLSNDNIEEVILKLEKIKKSGSGVISFDVSGEKQYLQITSFDIKQAVKSVFEKTIGIVRRCMHNGGVLRVDKVILVGGSTKSEFIKEFLGIEFPLTEILDSYKPDESVALGACIQGLADDDSDFVNIDDIVPLTIGIRSFNNNKEGFSKLIYHGEKLPCSKNKIYDIIGNAGFLQIDIYQGDSSILAENIFLGSANFNIPENAVELELNFLVDLNGILHVSVITNNYREEVELTDIFSIKSVDDSYEATLDKVERKKYLRWLQVLKDNGASEKDLKSYTEEFKKGLGKEFVAKFNSSDIAESVSIKRLK